MSIPLTARHRPAHHLTPKQKRVLTVWIVSSWKDLVCEGGAVALALARRGRRNRATRDLDKLSAGRPTSIELFTPFAEQMDVAVISQDDGFLAI